MSTQLTQYSSTDASAPTVSGTAGDYVNLLNKCLVTGYGTKVAAGWSSPYTGTNKAVYRPGGGIQHYFRVQDDAGGTGGAKEALVRGFTAMTAVDTGTGPFPSAAQSALTSNSLVARKSATADATTRAWTVFADDRTAYILIQSGDTASTYLCIMIGEFYSLGSSDVGRSMVIARAAENSISSAFNVEYMATMSAQLGASSVNPGHYAATAYTGLGGSTAITKSGDTARSLSATTIGLNGITLPNPMNAAAYAAQLVLSEGATVERGRLRGLWQWCHPAASVADGTDYTPASGDLFGKTFRFIKFSGGAGVYMFETSATLETN